MLGFTKTIKLDKQTLADISFLESVKGFLDVSDRESVQILRDNLNHVKDFNSNGFRFFVSDLCVAIIQKDFQSLEDIFLFDLHRLDSSGGVYNQGTSILLRFTCIEAAIKHMFDMYVKKVYKEPYEIQHVVISLNFEKKKKRKNVL